METCRLGADFDGETMKPVQAEGGLTDIKDDWVDEIMTG